MKTKITTENNIVYPLKEKLPFCACGTCGMRVTINRDTKLPNKYIQGHTRKGKKYTVINKNQNELSICQCGTCGLRVSNRKNKFIRGHNKPWKGIKRGNFSLDTKLKMSKSAKGKIKTPEHRLNLSRSSLGKKMSDISRIKMSKANIGKVRSVESRLKQSITSTGHEVLEETKVKISISIINYIEKHKFNGKPMSPRVGNNEILILDQLEKAIELKIDRNSRKLSRITGKFNDGFIYKYNLGIDVLEDHHFKRNGELSDNDQNRELKIAWKLGCMIYYIPEQEFLKNPEKEIQRLKDFLILLDQGVN